MKRVGHKLLMILISLGIGFGFWAATEFTAQAAASQIIVYNSSKSCGQIEAYNNTSGEHYKLDPGRYHAIRDYGSARADVDVGAQGCDVDSWFKWDEEPSSLGWEAPDHYGVCYNNEDESSDPYSAYYNEVTAYRTFAKLYCNP
jgi:hypothetical protein